MVAVDTLDTLVDLGMIKDGMNVLDVGCFIGNWAKTIRPRFNVNYVGLDVNKFSLAKARNRVPDYKFLHMDVNNVSYNPKGKVSASSASFPVEDDWADLVICHSLFTHLGKYLHAKRYIDETCRVLKPGGFLWATFFKSPPNEVSTDTARTVYTKSQINELITGFTMLYFGGGETTDYNDQLMMALRKEL